MAAAGEGRRLAGAPPKWSMVATDSTDRTLVHGKFFESDGAKIYVRGLTYVPRTDGASDDFQDRAVVDEDFARIASIRLNAVRTVGVPPAWLVDAAWHQGLRVMVGLPIERWLASMIDGVRQREIEDRIRSLAHELAARPGVLCYVLGSELEPSIVQWFGSRRVERLLGRAARIIRREDPAALVTHLAGASPQPDLQLDFQDFVACRIPARTKAEFERDVTGWHRVAGDRPLVVEITADGLDDHADPEPRRLGSYVRSAIVGGCAGVLISVPSAEIRPETATAQRMISPPADERRANSGEQLALVVARSAFTRSAPKTVPFGPRRRWPRISVAVCTRNSSDTIRDCLDGVRQLEYPDYETIVVDDASTDHTPAIARARWVRLVPNAGSGPVAGRNTALEAATGEIVAFLHDDVVPDRHWLMYLAAAFNATKHAAIGGQVIARPETRLVAEAIAISARHSQPVGGSSDIWDGLPGGTLAFRRSSLRAVGGFDLRFTEAGAEVDVSWRLQDRGWTLGFSPGAVAWRGVRPRVGDVWRDESTAGRTEGQLEQRWPRRFTVGGSVAARSRGADTPPGARLLSPEWYLFAGALLGLTALGIVWAPLLLAGPPLLIAVAASVLQAIRTSSAAQPERRQDSRFRRLRRRSVLVFLYLLRPAARLSGRMRAGLTPWRRKVIVGLSLPRPRTIVFTAKRESRDDWLRALEEASVHHGSAASRRHPSDPFDLEDQAGTFGRARLLLVLEDRPPGEQVVRIRVWPVWTRWAAAAGAAPTILAVAAFAGAAPGPAGLFALLALDVGLRAYTQSSAAVAVLRQAAERLATERATGDREAVERAASDLAAEAVTSERAPSGEISSLHPCRGCGLTLAPSAKFCRGCGAPTDARTPVSSPSSAQR